MAQHCMAQHPSHTLSTVRGMHGGCAGVTPSTNGPVTPPSVDEGTLDPVVQVGLTALLARGVVVELRDEPGNGNGNMQPGASSGSNRTPPCVSITTHMGGHCISHTHMAGQRVAQRMPRPSCTLHGCQRMPRPPCTLHGCQRMRRPPCTCSVALLALACRRGAV